MSTSLLAIPDQLRNHNQQPRFEWGAGSDMDRGMILELIEPTAIRSSQGLLSEYAVGTAFYLGYGRNSWNSNWTNKYYPDSVSFDCEKLKRSAESRRVQGSVFKIEAIPIWILRYDKSCFGICPINERSLHEYGIVLKNIYNHSHHDFWQNLPSSAQNWMLVFRISADFKTQRGFTPSMLKSYSNGARYLLGWSVQNPSLYKHFLDFSKHLMLFLLLGAADSR